MILEFLLTLANAKDLPGEELYTAPVREAASPLTSVPAVPASTLSHPNQLIPKTQSGNLPREYLSPTGRQSTNAELVQPPKTSGEVLRALKVGENLDLLIDNSLIAFPDEKPPAVGLSIDPRYKGMKFIGETTLEPNSRRIFLNFTKVAVGDRVYEFKGIGLTTDGQTGFEGEFHSNEGKLFAGDFAAAGLAGYFDGLVQRETTPFGQTISDNSVDAATKRGLASGLQSTADRFREKLKKAPEFSELRGPISLKLLILEQPTTKN